MSKTKPNLDRLQHRSSRRCLLKGLPALLLPLSPLLLGGCGSIPLPLSLPEVSLKPSQLKEPQIKAPTGTTQPSDPSLAPLATPQQVVKAVDLGRPDPFAAVMTARLTSGPDTPSPGAGKGSGSAKGSPPPKPPQPLEWPPGLVFQGVVQGGGKIEALVQYTPANAGGEGARSGALRVGEMGNLSQDSVLPPGWRVEAIDGTQGELVLRQGGRTVSRKL